MATRDHPARRPQRPGPWPPAADPAAAPPQPQPLSWARRTGYRPQLSGESNAANSGQLPLQPTLPEPRTDLEAQTLPTPPPPPPARPPERENRERTEPPPPPPAEPVRRRAGSDGPSRPAHPPAPNGPVASAPPNGPAPAPPPPPARRRRDEEAAALPQVLEDDDLCDRPNVINYQLRDTPGLVPILFYGIQHYLSMLGSLILMPLIIVPAMGGTDEDTSAVVQTVLFVSGVTTLLNTLFGSRLPLVQGPSFVYLAPVLAIVNSPGFLGLSENNFKHIMKELQGSLIISSAFQAIMGYSGLMSLLLRLINPVVVCPTVAAIGLSFFSYGFTQLSTCLEIGIVQILLVVIFSLYLRKIRILGHRIFLIYAVPLGLAVTWAIAFLLMEAGAYSYKGCDINVPVSNTISTYCRKHVPRMKHCRVDTSHVLRSSPWFRFPYPFQWGTPTFSWRMAFVMCAVSVIASADSVGSYHASSLFVAFRPPTPGVVSRGVGMEGVSSILAALWGTGAGSSTLTENIHTIAVTKMGSRRAVELGAVILILLSVIGKVGGFIASIPDVMVAALLCFMWGLLAAIGLSNLRYGVIGSSRNNLIVGLSLFLSLSIPAYFQQYGIVPNANSSVPSYLQPYIVASHGPFHTGNDGVNYVLNTLLSLNMVIAFLVAVILDNTVPGGQEERGAYVWSNAEDVRTHPSISTDYQLPFRVGRALRWIKWVGL